MDSNYEQFNLGVQAVFKRWTTLRLAIDNGWGGINSAMKAENLFNDMLAFFEPGGKEVDVYVVADYIEDFFNSNFSADIGEDGSAIDVANRIFTLFEQCMNSNYGGVAEEMEKMRQEGHSIPEPQIEQGEAMDMEIEKGPVEVQDDDGWTVVRRH